MKRSAPNDSSCCPPASLEPDLRPVDGAAADLELAELAKALGHPARVQIVRLLVRENTCICGEIVDEVSLAQSTARGAGLVALILTFGPISGAHFNPAVTLADAWQRGLAWRDVPAYLIAQIGGAFVGVAAAHGMFGECVFSASTHVRSGPS